MALRIPCRIRALLFALVLTAPVWGQPGLSAPAVQGIKDVTQHQGTVPRFPLDGEWKFIAGKMLDAAGFDREAGSAVVRLVPDLWDGSDGGALNGTGCGTYRLTVFVPEDVRNWALYMPTVATACEVEVNGQLVFFAGKTSDNQALHVPAYRSGIARIKSTGNQLDIIIRVSNYEYRSGGLWHAPVLGPERLLVMEKRQRDFAMSFLVAMLFAFSVNAIVIFAFRRKEKSYLFYALATFIAFLRGLCTGDYLINDIVPGIPFSLLIRLEYATAFLSLPIFILFLDSHFKNFLPGRLRHVVSWPFLPFALLMVFAPLPILTRSLVVFYPLAIAVLLAGMYLFTIRVVRAASPGSRLVLAGFLVIVAASVNDILYSSFVVNTGDLLPYAVLVLVFLMSLMLARRYARNFQQTEAISVELQQAKLVLEQELETRTMLMREIHHRVKNSLQTVSSITSLQARRTDDPVVLEALASLRLRIRAISLVHEKLYGLVSSEKVDPGAYLQELLQLLSASYESHPDFVRFSLQGVVGAVEMDMCVDLGLMTTELVSNGFKHVIVPKQGTLIAVQLSMTGDLIVLDVSNDGPPFPDDFKLSTSASLGFKLIYSLLGRWGGSYTVLPPQQSLQPDSRHLLVQRLLIPRARGGALPDLPGA